MKGKKLSEELSVIVRSNCLKKNEERWKFIYKKTIKFLKQLYVIRINNIKSNPTENDFLKFYFEEISKSTKNPLDYYQDPLIQKYRKRKSRVKDEKRPKSINTFYLSLIFKSKTFVKDYFEYIDGKLLEECLSEISDKFKLIFKNYIESFETEKVKHDYFAWNKRCKLPWTFYDVCLAINAMKIVKKDIDDGHFA